MINKPEKPLEVWSINQKKTIPRMINKPEKPLGVWSINQKKTVNVWSINQKTHYEYDQ